MIHLELEIQVTFYLNFTTTIIKERIISCSFVFKLSLVYWQKQNLLMKQYLFIWISQRGQGYLWLFWRIEPLEIPTEFQSWERIAALFVWFICLWVNECLVCRDTALDLVMKSYFYFYESEEPSLVCIILMQNTKTSQNGYALKVIRYKNLGKLLHTPVLYMS